MGEKKNKFNLFRLLQNVSLIGIILIVTLIVLFVTKAIEVNNYFVQFTSIVGLLLVGVLMVLPWAKYMEEQQYKIVSIIFMVATGICEILWIICDILIFNAYRSPETASLSIVHFIRVTLIISFQLVVASFIGKFIIKYQAKYVPFQAIAYIAMLYLDFFFSVLLCGIRIENGEFDYNQGTWFFIAKQWPFLLIAFIYLGIVYGVITNSRKRRVRNAILAKSRTVNKDIGLIDLEDDDDEDKKPAPVTDYEAQLEKLKSMLDKGLLTQEEYNTKRQAIIEKM